MVSVNIVGSTEAPSKVFPLFFLFYDWLKTNHLKIRIERGFLNIFPRHYCSAVTETIQMTNYATSLGAKNVKKTKFEAAVMILDAWNQQNNKYDEDRRESAIILKLEQINIRLETYLRSCLLIYYGYRFLYLQSQKRECMIIKATKRRGGKTCVIEPPLIKVLTIIDQIHLIWERYGTKGHTSFKEKRHR